MNEKTKEENEFIRQVTNVPSESTSSVEIKQTTKGTTFTVKVYDVDPDEATKKAVTIFDKLGTKYPQVKA